MRMRMEMHELVAESPAEYTEIAVQLLYDLPSVLGLREESHSRFHDVPLTDPKRLTSELESVIRNWVLH